MLICKRMSSGQNKGINGFRIIAGRPKYRRSSFATSGLEYKMYSDVPRLCGLLSDDSNPMCKKC